MESSSKVRHARKFDVVVFIHLRDTAMNTYIPGCKPPRLDCVGRCWALMLRAWAGVMVASHVAGA
jgi:hypothetical protein